MNETDLINKGFIRQPDGSWAKRPVPVGAVEANRSEPTSVRSLVQSVQKPACGPSSVAICVRIVALRRRLLDAHDAVAYACKPLTDAIAEGLGCDDADKRIEWEYFQERTRGPEGVIVLISTK